MRNLIAFSSLSATRLVSISVTWSFRWLKTADHAPILHIDCLRCIPFDENHWKMPSISTERPHNILNFRTKLFGCLLICHFSFSAAYFQPTPSKPDHDYTSASESNFYTIFQLSTSAFAQHSQMCSKPIRLIKCVKRFSEWEMCVG